MIYADKIKGQLLISRTYDDILPVDEKKMFEYANNKSEILSDIVRAGKEYDTVFFISGVSEDDLLNGYTEDFVKSISLDDIKILQTEVSSYTVKEDITEESRKMIRAVYSFDYEKALERYQALQENEDLER